MRDLAAVVDAARSLLLAPRPRGDALRIGFVFNVKRDTESDAEAEFDSPATIAALHDAIASFGHEVIDLEATPEIPLHLIAAQVDLVFNIAEGRRGRNRESVIPALCELLGLPFVGSDSATLSLCLDKDLSKRVVASHGIAVPRSFVLERADRVPAALDFPLVVKPIAEGTSKGVTARSLVRDQAALIAIAGELIDTYAQPVVVEEYVEGRELTLGVLGHPPRVLPPKETVFLDPNDPAPIYTYDLKQDWNERVRHDAPAVLTPTLLERVNDAALRAYHALGCRDIARIDFRLRGEVPVFIEANPLPGLSPGWSDLALIGKAAGLEHRDLIGAVIDAARARTKDGVRSAL